jgi:hypothetical protein
MRGIFVQRGFAFARPALLQILIDLVRKLAESNTQRAHRSLPVRHAGTPACVPAALDDYRGDKYVVAFQTPDRRFNMNSPSSSHSRCHWSTRQREATPPLLTVVLRTRR